MCQIMGPLFVKQWFCCGSIKAPLSSITAYDGLLRSITDTTYHGVIAVPYTLLRPYHSLQIYLPV